MLSTNPEPPNEKPSDDDGEDGKAAYDISDDNDDDKKPQPKEERNITNILANTTSINNPSQNTLFNTTTFENTFLNGNLGVFSSLPEDIFTN